MLLWSHGVRLSDVAAVRGVSSAAVSAQVGGLKPLAAPTLQAIIDLSNDRVGAEVAYLADRAYRERRRIGSAA